MSDEFCAGVQILLKRMESNPDEFREEFGKWGQLVNAVFARKLGENAVYVRALTDAEVDELYKGLIKIYRPTFDAWVMKEVLAEPEERASDSISAEQAWQMSRGKQIIGSGWNDPRMAQRAQNSVIAGGSGGSGQVQVKPESVMSKLKRELGL